MGKEVQLCYYYDGLIAGLWVWGAPPKINYDPDQMILYVELGNGSRWEGRWSKLNPTTCEMEIKIDLLRNCVRYFVEKGSNIR